MLLSETKDFFFQFSDCKMLRQQANSIWRNQKKKTTFHKTSALVAQ